jgi:hypothetical protein
MESQKINRIIIALVEHSYGNGTPKAVEPYIEL